MTRLLLLGALVLLAACTGTADIARRPAVSPTEAQPLDVFRTLQVETGTHSDAVTSLAVDRAEVLLLTGSADKTARLWNVADGAPRGVLRPPIGEGDLGHIDAVALSADGRLAAIGGRSAGPTRDAVLLFDTRDRRLIGRLERPSAASDGDSVARIAFADDGERLAVRYAPGGATVTFDVRSGRPSSGPSAPGDLLGRDTAPRQLGLTRGRQITADDSGRIVLSEASGGAVWEIASASLDIDRIAVSADASRVRMAGPGFSKLFSAATMDWIPPDAPGGGDLQAAGDVVPVATPLSLDDGSIVHTDGSRIQRTARDGSVTWRNATSHRVKAIAVAADGGAVVAALGDGTLRWYDAATGAERLALYPHVGRGWVAWTPDGFFDHSEEAWNFAGWHVNRGPRQAAEFVKIGQLYDVAYRPDLISLAHAGRALTAEAVRLGDAVDPRERLAGGLPPRIAIAVSPSPDRRTAVVDAEVQEQGGGIGRLLYRVNGVVVAVDRPGDAAPPRSAATLQMRRTVPLRNGPNQIEVVALDGADELESVPAVGTIPDGRADARQGQLWAVVVGINAYADPGMRLTYARPDGEAISAALARLGASGFTGTNVVTLLDGEAGTANLVSTIATMSETMAESDTFILYLSGHGVNLRGRFRFLTHDVTAPTQTQAETLGLTQETLRDLLANVPAGRAIVILDTCYSGSAITLGDRNMLIRNADRRLARATGRSVLAAATDRQEALEGYRGHGVLTYVLLEGLNGSAAPATEAITARALGDYAVDRVPAISAQVFEAEQVPVFTFVGQDIVLVRRR